MAAHRGTTARTAAATPAPAGNGTASHNHRSLKRLRVGPGRPHGITRKRDDERTGNCPQALTTTCVTRRHCCSSITVDGHRSPRSRSQGRRRGMARPSRVIQRAARRRCRNVPRPAVIVVGRHGDRSLLTGRVGPGPGCGRRNRHPPSARHDSGGPAGGVGGVRRSRTRCRFHPVRSTATTPARPGRGGGGGHDQLTAT